MKQLGALLPAWAALALIILAAPTGALGAPDAPDARAIMAQAFDQQAHQTFSARVEMALIDQGGGQRTRTMQLFSRRDGQVSKRAVFFLDPADIRGTAFLSISRAGPGTQGPEAEQWIYFPGLAKTKRIAAGESTQSFMGSDLNYGDMARRGLDGFSYKLLRTDQVRGHAVWLIEALPESEDMAQRVGYSRAVYLVRQDSHAIVRAINWLLTGNRMRYLDVLRLEQVSGVWTPLEVQVWTSAGKAVLHKTILRSSQVKVGLDLPPDLFSKQRLEKGL